jgi:hypothetical protein
MTHWPEYYAIQRHVVAVNSLSLNGNNRCRQHHAGRFLSLVADDSHLPHRPPSLGEFRHREAMLLID